VKAIISRTYQNNVTIGTFLLMDGERPVHRCKTLELPWYNNMNSFSCIPEGVYDVVKWDSPKFGKCFKVVDVKDRTDILIHYGNFTKDTLGCIIVGNYLVDLNNDGNTDIAESRKAMDDLLKYCPDKFKLYII